MIQIEQISKLEKMVFKFLQTSRLCPEKNFIFGNQSIASSTDIKISKTIQIGDAGDKPTRLKKRIEKQKNLNERERKGEREGEREKK